MMMQQQETQRTMTTTELKSCEIVCDGCANSVIKAISRLPDVTAVDVDVPTHTVKVTHATTISREEIAGAMLKAGFPPA